VFADFFWESYSYGGPDLHGADFEFYGHQHSPMSLPQYSSSTSIYRILNKYFASTHIALKTVVPS
jgi:hypothetical protein